MGPTVEARGCRGAVAGVAGTTVVVGATTVGSGTIIVAGVTAVARVAVVVATVVLVATATRRVTEQGHHVLHLPKESSFAGGDCSLALVNDRVRNASRSISRNRESSIGFGGRGKSVKETLSNEIGNRVGSVGLMEDIPCVGEGTEIGLSVTKVGEHVVPGLFDERTAIPETEVMLEDRLLGEDDKSKVHHLTGSHGRSAVFSEIRKIFNDVEDRIHRLGDVKGHVIDIKFFSLNLLRSHFAMSSK
jgi:hypothetical protein